MDMLTTGTHFREASEALAHCYADLLEGRLLTGEEYSAAMRVLRIATAIIGTADSDVAFNWECLREYLYSHARYSVQVEERDSPAAQEVGGCAVDHTLKLTVLRDGRLITICFRELRKGDMTCSPRVPRIVVGENAHQSEDPDYSGWLVYDESGSSYFPEDFRPKLV